MRKLKHVKYTPWVVGVLIWMIVAFIRQKQFIIISLAPIAFLVAVYIHQKRQFGTEQD